MKTPLVDSLVFNPHPVVKYGDAKQAKISFDNGITVSVLTGKPFYSLPKKPYEAMVIDTPSSNLWPPDLFNETKGYLTKKELEQFLQIISHVDKDCPTGVPIIQDEI